MTYAVTDAQQRVLRMIRAYIKARGYSPSYEDICEELGFKSRNSVHEHILKLAKHGLIKHAPGVARSIRVMTND